MSVAQAPLPNGRQVDAHDDTAVLRAVHLTKHFPVRSRLGAPQRVVHAVEDVSFDLPARKVLALVGESGSGKSTLARLFSRLYAPTSGDILYRGQLVEEIDPRAYRRTVQMVFQDPYGSLNPVHQVAQTIGRPLRIHRKVRSKSEELERVRELLSLVDLTPVDDFLFKFPHELSGGQRQRVVIARALAVEPPVILADEPISMLDVSLRMGLLNLMLKLREEQDLTYLYITHDLASARYMADQIAVMYAGELVELGPAEDVIKEPLHPYTQLLLSAVPDPEAGLRREGGSALWANVPGEIPSLIDPPSGCRFHTRCPFVTERCRQETPAMYEPSAGRKAHCFRYDEAGAEG